MSTDSGVETQTSSSSSDWKCGDGASFELVDEMVMSEVEEVSGGQLTPYEGEMEVFGPLESYKTTDET